MASLDFKLYKLGVTPIWWWLAAKTCSGENHAYISYMLCVCK